MIDKVGILSIVELVCFTPCIFLAAYVAWKHGFGRDAGWLFLIIFSVVRVVGSIMYIVAENENNQTVLIVALVFNNVALSPLLLAMYGLLKRLNDQLLPSRGIGQRQLALVHLPILVGIILASVGGSGQASAKTPADTATGKKESEAGSILVLVGFLLLVVATGYIARFRSFIQTADRKLLFFIGASIPFLAVRIAYSIASSFSGTTSSTFGLISETTTAVIARSLMAFIEELAVVLIYITAGVVTPTVPRSTVQPSRHQDPEEAKEDFDAHQQETGYARQA